MILTAHIILAVMMTGLSLYFRRSPPQKINSLYGYRTSLSMKNGDTWKEANRYSSRLQVKLALAFAVFCILSYWLVGGINSLMLSCGFLTVTSIALIPLTEYHLKGIFNEHGERHEKRDIAR